MNTNELFLLLTHDIFSEKIVPFGIAVNASSVSVVGTWRPPDVEDLQNELLIDDEDSEMEREAKYKQNEIIREKVK
jgi:hypothetical protein